MVKQGIEEQALAHVVTIPAYLLGERVGRGVKGLKYAKIAETLRIMDREKGLKYSKEEFESEFGGLQYFRTALRKMLLKDKLKVRVILDGEFVYVFANTASK